MKKTILISMLFAIASTTLNSCKKEYFCDCKKVYSGSSGTTTSDDGVYTFTDSRTRAESRCNQEEKTGTDLLGGNYSRECEIR
ncbi:MAG TPA: hypothetical protein VF868_06205 [Bacteroidia bacterium]|jgi:hypothetical protein